ncbi:MAG TPA: iron-sulfur cluster loop [Candidatus Cloacimonetes bacterium]|nr:iron-sulfur cluster loop [Candidatus Cloacimonadota bacterium]
MNQDKIAAALIKRGNELFNLPYKKVNFTGNEEADTLLNDLRKFPHAYVLACIMDRQIKAERAWLIPYLISQELGSFDFERLLKLDLDSLKEIFKRKSLHRFNDVMAANFFSAIQLIHTKYQNDAANIWKNKPKSATVVRRFLEFKGVGIKISTMAVNILAREFKITLQDRICIDISLDVQVKRVFTRLGFISEGASNEELIYCARELHSEYPGIFDFSAWEIGREWCRPSSPDCKNCFLNRLCPKII